MTSCFVEDFQDHICSECDAKDRAKFAVGAAKADISNKKNRIMAVAEFDSMKFEKTRDIIINYWKEYYIQHIDSVKYSFWLEKFDNYVEEFMRETINAFSNINNRLK